VCEPVRRPVAALVPVGTCEQCRRPDEAGVIAPGELFCGLGLGDETASDAGLAIGEAWSGGGGMIIESYHDTSKTLSISETHWHTS
jgi:hypothetical protein